MPYNELIKSFRRIREYMREFYLYGFKSREEYTAKSARSYDNERRRVESWLGTYMGFRQTPGGKQVFLSMDSRECSHNPLYKAWKTKSFTDGDITLHFLLFDILYDPGVGLSLREILDGLYERQKGFQAPREFDESTVRKKLAEYEREGLVAAEKTGRMVIYRRTGTEKLPNVDLLDFYSETAPCGVVGSFLLDKIGEHTSAFRFKHHYITGALDTEIACRLFVCMREHRFAVLETVNRKRETQKKITVYPLKCMISVQSGRQYLMAYLPAQDRVSSFRLDMIVSLEPGEVCPDSEEYDAIFTRMLPHIWGVSTQSFSGDRMQHVEFTVRYEEGEEFIHRRLVREKRCGTVEKTGEHTSRFRADVYDASELVPWIRTFVGRITEVHFSDQALERRFLDDLEEMYALYAEEGGERE